MHCIVGTFASPNELHTEDCLTADLGHNPGVFLINFPQKIFSRVRSLSLKQSRDGFHTHLNRGIGGIPIIWAWKFHRNMLNLSLQHDVEAELILHSYSEIVHIRAHVLQKLISCMNTLAKMFVDFQLISDNISERRLIHVEILPITALLAVVKKEIGLISS
jgi:hypothetical protein